jgi:hypothetical protein
VADGFRSREFQLGRTTVSVLPGQSAESLPARSTELLNKVELKRELGLFSAVNLNVGCMIGKRHRREVLTALTAHSAHHSQLTAHLGTAMPP